MSDLRPWVCCQVACGCSREPYTTREQWLEHLRAQHVLHPEWDNTRCPFCHDMVEGGDAKMVTHVEHHLQELSLNVLPRTEEEDGEDDDLPDKLPDSIRIVSSMPDPSDPGGRESIESHPVYATAAPKEDGLWHCPWEGEDCCKHEPSVLRSDFE
jgi:hypothetical protein